MTDDVFKAKQTVQEVEMLINLFNGLSSSKIDMSPYYQRGLIWSVEKQRGFIDSLIRNIIPNPLIFNYDTSNGKRVVMDGVQRLSSIMNYYHNKFSVVIGDDNVYYSDDKDGRKMDDKEQAMLMSRNIFVIVYENLSIENQVCVFSRIQNGEVLKKSEIMTTVFANEKTAVAFNKYCDTKKSLFLKFTDIDTHREEHRTVIINIMRIIEEERLVMMSTTGIKKYIEHFKTVNDIENIIKKCDKVIDITFGNKLLNHKDFTKSIKKKYMLILAHAMSVEDLKDIDLDVWRVCAKKIFIDAEAAKNAKGLKKYGNSEKDLIKIYDSLTEFVERND